MRITCYIFISIVFAMAIASAQTETGNELNDRGLAATDKREFDLAKQLFTQAIQTWQARGPQYDAHVAIVKTNLAQVYSAEGRRAECAAILEDAMVLFRRTLGIQDIRALAALNLLGSVQMMLGNHARAAEIFAEALPIERKLYPQSAELGRTLGGMASLAMKEDRAADAMPLAEEALAVTLKTEGENTLDTAVAYANVAEGYRTANQPDRAEPLFRKSLSIYENLLGPDHPRVSSILTQQGLMMLAAGKLGMAEKTLQRAVDILDKSCPGCDFERVTAENDLALLRVRQGKLNEADRLLTDVLALQEKAKGLPPGNIAVTLQSLATVRRKERMFADAERLQRRAASLASSYR